MKILSPEFVGLKSHEDQVNALKRIAIAFIRDDDTLIEYVYSENTVATEIDLETIATHFSSEIFFGEDNIYSYIFGDMSVMELAEIADLQSSGKNPNHSKLIYVMFMISSLSISAHHEKHGIPDKDHPNCNLFEENDELRFEFNPSGDNSRKITFSAPSKVFAQVKSGLDKLPKTKANRALHKTTRTR